METDHQDKNGSGFIAAEDYLFPLLSAETKLSAGTKKIKLNQKYLRKKSFAEWMGFVDKKLGM